MGSNAVGSDSVIPAGWTEIPSTGTPF
jgi:hypothetical protein